MSTTANITDVNIKRDVLSELAYTPSSLANDIRVSVLDGQVTLDGYVHSYWGKLDAAEAARGVYGVNSVIDEITVRLPENWILIDKEIEEAANSQLKWSSILPRGSVSATVKDGWLTLNGDVEWWYQKNASENLVHHLSGVRGVSNLVELKPRATPSGVEAAIASSFKRSAVLEAAGITIGVQGNKVTLKGSVGTFAEVEQASRAAWSAAGVIAVDNQLLVDYTRQTD
jgi:osmotically-inducible protein OsmY